MKTPRRLKRKHKWILAGSLMGMLILAIPITAYITYQLFYYHRVFPVILGGINLTGMTLPEAQLTLDKRVNDFTNQNLKITNQNQTWELPLNKFKLNYPTEALVKQAYSTGRDGTILDQIKTQEQLINKPMNLPLQVTYSQEFQDELVASLAADINVPMIPPTIIILSRKPDQNDGIEIIPGQDGREINNLRLKQLIAERLRTLSNNPIPLPIEAVGANNDEAAFNQAKDTARAFINKTLTLKVDDINFTKTWSLNDEAMIGFIKIGNDFDRLKINQYLSGVAETVNRTPDNAKFKFNEQTGKVEEFAPARDGLQLYIDKSTDLISQALEVIATGEIKESITLAVGRTKPDVTLENANTLGIKELIGRGTSTYKGSIPTRVHNVALAASRITGTLVKPGETFSFNQAVGDVSGETGYQQAYIIRNGRTELGDGGGVCQDSTTMFRAALNAGLPITERHAHAYRVGYYEQDTKAGIDATVYAPSPDLKFTNDTANYILIQATPDTPNRTLVVDIYGTSDGRQASISNHVVWDVTPPLPDVYVDDPTLPSGQTKQVDWKAGGAKAKFDYLVTRNGETIIQKTFYSTYKPWAAVFLRGTQ